MKKHSQSNSCDLANNFVEILVSGLLRMLILAPKLPTSITKKWIKQIAESGFDPPTSGLWAQHASTAPLCLLSHHSKANFQLLIEFSCPSAKTTRNSYKNYLRLKINIITDCQYPYQILYFLYLCEKCIYNHKPGEELSMLTWSFKLERKFCSSLFWVTLQYKFNFFIISMCKTLQFFVELHINHRLIELESDSSKLFLRPNSSFTRINYYLECMFLFKILDFHTYMSHFYDILIVLWKSLVSEILFFHI